MARHRNDKARPTLHIELFVTARPDRVRVRRAARDLYRLVGPVTKRAGGAGPALYLMQSSRRKHGRLSTLRHSVGARRDEDLWVELAFYPTQAAARRLIRSLRNSAEILGKADAAEQWNRKRVGSWTVDYGALQSA